MTFKTTWSHLGAWCTKKCLVGIPVLALLAYKKWRSAHSVNQGPAVASVRHPVLAEPTKEPPEEAACEETWSEATEQKANLSSGVWVWVRVCGSCKPIDEYPNALRGHADVEIRLVSLLPTGPPILLYLLLAHLLNGGHVYSQFDSGCDVQSLAAQSDPWGPHVPAWIQRSSISKPFSLAEVRPCLLPEEVIQGVHAFVFFIGIGKSGTTILSLLLDAHPNAIVANNYAFFVKWPIDPAFHRDRSFLYSAIFRQSKKQAVQHQDRQPSLRGSDAYLGKYQDHVFVVGDKEAGTATKFYRTDRQLWKQVFAELQQTVNVPIKLIQVVRNPFDVIASLAFMLTPGGDDMKKSEQAWTIASVSGFEEAQANFFDNQQAVQDILHDPDLSNVSIHCVHLADLVHSPSQEMEKLCSYLGLTCFPSYVKVCQNTIYNEVSMTRHRIQWTPEVRKSIEQKMKQFPWLRSYDFTSK